MAHKALRSELLLPASPARCTLPLTSAPPGGLLSIFPLPGSVSVLPLLGNLKGHSLGKPYLILESRLGFPVNP